MIYFLPSFCSVYRYLLSGLTPNTKYKVEVLGFYVDEKRKSECSFRTYPSPEDQGTCSFLLGSCRAPDEHGGYAYKGDRIFGRMATEANINFSIFCGGKIFLFTFFPFSFI